MAGFSIDALKKMIDVEWKKRLDRYRKYGYTDEMRQKDAEKLAKQMISKYSVFTPEIVDYIKETIK